jgi:hypothetical protein
MPLSIKGGSEVCNILLVEGKSDKEFINALIKHMFNSEQKHEDKILLICDTEDYQCYYQYLTELDQDKVEAALAKLKDDLVNQTRKIQCLVVGGIQEQELKSLKKALVNLKNELLQTGRNVEKIGIIIDLDQDTVENRLRLVNAAIQEVFGKEFVISRKNEENDWITVRVDSDVSVKISCYFMNVDGKGELETVLKAIACKTSTHADCLAQWRECIGIENKLTDKEFDKLWVQVYQRYDCCSKKDREKAEKNCSNLKRFLKKEFYNFNSPVLADLREFLKIASLQTSLNCNVNE